MRHAVLAAGETGKHGGALWHAYGTVGVGALVPDAFIGDLIKMGCHHRMSAIGDAEAVAASLIKNDENDIGFLAWSVIHSALFLEAHPASIQQFQSRCLHTARFTLP